jgi:tRNA-Thr(GGU) m(6)t(6)A37 methyltransferase TsaA
MKFKPIGFVRKGTVVIDRRWAKGLTGIEGYSHLLVLTFLHESHKPDMFIRPKGGPKGTGKFPRIGFLATRTGHRPNPIGFTVVRLLKRRGAVLQVKGLDVRDGTPVLDVKPYTKREDVGRYRIPTWVKRLDRLEKDPLRRYGS